MTTSGSIGAALVELASYRVKVTVRQHRCDAWTVDLDVPESDTAKPRWLVSCSGPTALDVLESALRWIRARGCVECGRVT